MKTESAVDRRNVFLYNIYRLVVLTSLLVSAIIIQLSSPESPANLPFYYLILGAYVFSALFFALYAGGRRLVFQAYLQVVFDLLLITAFVYISGGIASSMYFLYLFPIIAAGLVISGRAGFLAASLSAILFGVLADGLYFGFIPAYGPEHVVKPPLGSMLVTMFVAWGVFFVIAALMSRLAGSLRRTREALRAAEKELLVRERLSEAGRVSASLAHEIRNPLAAISGSVQVLKKELVLSPEQNELMGIVLKESMRVSHSLDQFLDFALPAKQVFSPISLGDILDETVKILQAGGELNGKVELLGNFRNSHRSLFRQRRPVQAGLLEPGQERRQGHARRRTADARFPRGPPEGSPDRRRRHGPGDERRGEGTPLRAVLLRVRERARPGYVHRPQDRRRLRRPDRRPVRARAGDRDRDHAAAAAAAERARVRPWKRS